MRIGGQLRNGIKEIRDREGIGNNELERIALPRLYFIVSEQREYVQNAYPSLRNDLPFVESRRIITPARSPSGLNIKNDRTSSLWRRLRDIFQR